MATFPNVHDEKSLRAAVDDAVRQGSACVVVPFFSGTSHVFDDLVRDGTATGYTLLVEIALAPEGGAA